MSYFGVEYGGVGIAQWLQYRTPGRKSQVRVLTGTAGGFSSPGSTFCVNSYFGICSTPVLPQKNVKDPDHSAKTTAALSGGRSNV